MHSEHLKLTQQFLLQEPFAAGQRIESMPVKQAAELLAEVRSQAVVQILTIITPQFAASILSTFEEEKRLSLLKDMNINDVAGILRFCDRKTQRQIFICLNSRRRAVCQMLLHYSEHAVGSLVETNVHVIDHRMTIADVCLRVKKSRNAVSQTLYVVDNTRRVQGSVVMEELLKRAKDVSVSTLPLRSVNTVSGHAAIEDTLVSDMWNHQDSACVTNRRGEFIGLLFYHRLRRAQQKNARHISLRDLANGNLAAEVVAAYGVTINSVLDLFVRQPSVAHTEYKP